MRSEPGLPVWIFLFSLVVYLSGCGAAEDGEPGGDASSSPAVTEGVSGDAVAARGSATSSDDSRPAVLFFGTSLTYGYGLEERDRAFPALVQEKLDSAGMEYRTVNAGVPGETSAAGLRRIGWVLRNEDVDAVVVELGANDGLRGQDPEALRENLQAVIDSTRAHHPDAAVVLAGMEAPPNLGPRYTREFRSVFREMARENDAALIPFLLEGVAGEPELNQDDRIHPNEEGHRIVAETVWPVLERTLRAREADGETG